MSNKSKLIVVAGCNGSGKSSFSKAFVNKNGELFDYDIVYLVIFIGATPRFPF